MKLFKVHNANARRLDSASPLNLEHEVVSVASTSYLAIWNSQEAKRILILEIKSGKLLHKFNCNDMVSLSLNL